MIYKLEHKEVVENNGNVKKQDSFGVVKSNLLEYWDYDRNVISPYDITIIPNMKTYKKKRLNKE